MPLKKARILQACVVAGLQYKPDQVIEADSKLVEQLKAAGDVDDHKDAVAYCEKELGAKPIRHVDAEAQAAEAARADQVAALESKRKAFEAESDAAKKSALGEEIAQLEAALK